MQGLLILLSFLYILKYSVCYYKFENIKTEYDNYVIPLCIEDASTCYPFKLSTSSSEILILNGSRYNNSFNPLQSKELYISYNYGRKHNGQYIFGNNVKNHIFIKDTNVSLLRHKFSIIDSGLSDNVNYRGILGFGYDFTESGNETSLFAKLINNNYISNPVFSYGKKSLILGDTVKLNNNSKIYKLCPIEEGETFWSLIKCKVESVIYSGKKRHKIFSMNQSIRFNIEHHEIYAPLFFYDYLLDNIFFKYIKNNICRENINPIGDRYISCDTKHIELIEKDLIYIFIDNWNIKLRIKELFRDDVFLIFRAEWNNDWVIGHILMDNNIVTVDKKKNKLYWNP